jgi:hypothetical protein
MCLFIFGILEYGLLFRDYLTVANSSRTGARVGSAAGRLADADYQILQSLKSAASALPDGATSIQAISIYRASAAQAGPPTGCSTAASSANRCNHYTGADLARPATDFGCALGSPDRFWCPTSRSDSQSAGPDYLGVYVRTSHGSVTGLFGSSRTLTDSVVMRLEPKQS